MLQRHFDLSHIAAAATMTPSHKSRVLQSPGGKDGKTIVYIALYFSTLYRLFQGIIGMMEGRHAF